MNKSRLRKIGVTVLGAVILIVALGFLDRATEKSVEIPIAGIALNQIPTAPEWATKAQDRQSEQSVQIATRLIEVPEGAVMLDPSGVQVMSPEESESFFRKISTQRGTDLLTAPTIVCHDGANALVQVGRELVLPSAVGDTNSPEPSVVETGIKCHFLPRLADGRDSIQVDVFAQVVTLNGFLEGEESVEHARFDCITLSTAASVPPGQTAILGGILCDKKLLVHDRVPVLADIPFLGRFFRSTRIENNPRQFIMTLTPTLISAEAK